MLMADQDEDVHGDFGISGFRDFGISGAGDWGLGAGGRLLFQSGA
jgi:hypothetical protein